MGGRRDGKGGTEGDGKVRKGRRWEGRERKGRAKACYPISNKLSPPMSITLATWKLYLSDKEQH